MQLRSLISVNSPLSSINESILIVGTLISLPPYLLISSLKWNLNIKFIVNYSEVKRLKVQSIFNKNVIKLGDNKEYIKEAVDIIVILHAK